MKVVMMVYMNNKIEVKKYKIKVEILGEVKGRWKRVCMMGKVKMEVFWME
jgi:hypothetical protein